MDEVQQLPKLIQKLRALERLLWDKVVVIGQWLHKPSIDSTTAWQVQDKDGNVVLIVDTVNNRVGIKVAPSYSLHNSGTFFSSGGDFELEDAGTPDNGGIRVFSNSGNLYLQCGPTKNVIMRADNVTKVTLTNAGDVVATGDLKCSGQVSTDGGTTKWELAGYTASAPAAAGYVTITIGSTAYKLLAAPAA